MIAFRFDCNGRCSANVLYFDRHVDFIRTLSPLEGGCFFNHGCSLLEISGCATDLLFALEVSRVCSRFLEVLPFNHECELHSDLGSLALADVGGSDLILGKPHITLHVTGCWSFAPYIDLVQLFLQSFTLTVHSHITGPSELATILHWAHATFSPFPIKIVYACSPMEIHTYISQIHSKDVGWSWIVLPNSYYHDLPLQWKEFHKHAHAWEIKLGTFKGSKTRW